MGMHESKSGLRVRGVWLVALAAAAMVGVLAAGSPRAVHASDPPGDCWGGALSAEPLHCYILEEAQRAGVIEVAAIHVTPSNGLLVFVSHPAPWGGLPYLRGTDVAAFFTAKTAEFLERWPERVFFDHRFHQRCVYDGGGGPPYAEASAEVKAKYEDCVIRSVQRTSGELPYTKTYVRMDVMTGGADGVRKRGGWASFRQLWPASEPRDAPSGQFDVSDVDTVNFPEEMDCSAHAHLPTPCDQAKRYPDLGIAGWVISGWAEWSHRYVHIKAAPDDEERIRTVREALVAKGVDTDRLTIIPVRYSYEEMWRWTTILDRFALSASNTLGIVGAWIKVNNRQHEDDIFLSGMQDREDENYRTYRAIISVISQKPRETAAALPQLLGQLGIPVDAVGMVSANYEEVLGPAYPEVGLGDAVEDAATAVVSAVEEPSWTLIAVVGSTAAAVATCLAAMAFAVRRMRRQRA